VPPFHFIEQQRTMSESKNKAATEVLQEIERLREQNSQLMDDMLAYTGLPGQVHRQHARMEQLKILVTRAADALEKSLDGAHSHLVQELRTAAE
jgi:hypothetical protein